MKNRKTIIITAASIVTFRIMIFTGSKIFSERISIGDETENNLLTDIRQTENSSEIVFDYPYITEDELESHKDKPYYKFYENTVLFMNSVENAQYDNSLLTYQQAANIGGELVKYFYGHTFNQSTPSMIMLKNNKDEKTYIYALGCGTSDNMYSNNITMNIDAITGKVTFFNYRQPDGISPVEGVSEKLGNEISRTTKSNIQNKIKSDLSLLGYNADFEILNYGLDTQAFEGFLNYKVVVRIAEDDLKVLAYLTTDNNYFDIIMFTDYI